MVIFNCGTTSIVGGKFHCIYTSEATLMMSVCTPQSVGVPPGRNRSVVGPQTDHRPSMQPGSPPTDRGKTSVQATHSLANNWQGGASTVELLSVCCPCFCLSYMSVCCPYNNSSYGVSCPYLLSPVIKYNIIIICSGQIACVGHPVTSVEVDLFNIAATRHACMEHVTVY